MPRKYHLSPLIPRALKINGILITLEINPWKLTTQIWAEHLKAKIRMEQLEDHRSSKQVDYSLSKTREDKPKGKTGCNDNLPKWKSIQITRNIIMLSCKKWREIKSDKTWQITKNINKENRNSSIIILRLHQISISSRPSMVQGNNRRRCLKTL